MIRCAAKAIVVRGDCVLLNRCKRRDGGVYYDLPGGGQHPYESMEQAVVREVLEETGYAVRSLRFAALAEEIYTDEALRQKYPDYTHRVMHIFIAEAGKRVQEPSELDFGMEKSVWIPVDEIAALPELRPRAIQERITSILAGELPLYLGTEYVDWNQE